MPSFDRLGHWPYAADYCKSILDLDNLEDHAVRILARGLQTQRLVGFVGAGASMAYGRLTWSGLMSALWGAIQTFAAENEQSASAKAWKRIRETLWPKGERDFLDYSDHALKSQILSDMMQLSASAAGGGTWPTERAGAERLQQETKRLLETFHGFVERLVQDLFPDFASKIDITDGQVVFAAPDPQGSRRRRDAAQEPAYQGGRGLAGVLDILHATFNALPRATADSMRADLVQALSEQSIGLDSPIRHLALDWSIRRFITTNYDSEIERALTALDFVKRDRGRAEARANQFDSLNFSRNATGQALRFALEGPRRHASVLHLHGDIHDAASLIVTESHYQRLYLDDHPLRDLVNNATQANFAANPLLFVGSDVSEDDVLRPMREFMSGVGHRRDRMAVALFVTTKEQAKRAQRRVQLLLKHGVHAIDVGVAREVGRPNPTGEPWLYRLHEQLVAFRKLVKPDPGTTAPKDLPASLQGILIELRKLERVNVVEGISVGKGHELYFLGRFDKLLERLAQDGSEEPGTFAFNRLVALFENTFNWIAGCFLCAKLVELRRRAVEALDDDAKLALSYERPGSEPLESNPQVPSENPTNPQLRPLRLRKRHAVLLDHRELVARFSRIHQDSEAPQADSTFDEGIGRLCKAITDEPGFKGYGGRRVIIACAARGYGKGGQFDRLVARTVDPAKPTRDGDASEREHLVKLLQTLGGYEGPQPGEFGDALVFHANMSFSNELGPIISQVTRLLWEASGSAPTPECSDQMELLERALRALSARPRRSRLLIILGNAGVLYDAEGHPKNGQIRRVMRQLLSLRFRHAPIDILMYVGESQIPAYLREAPKREDHGEAGDGDEPFARGDDLFTPADEIDQRLRRRLERLNIKTRTRPNEHTIVHALKHSRVSDLATAYFNGLSIAMGWTTVNTGGKPPTSSRFPPKYSLSDRLARSLYLATGGSRYAQTIVLALLDAADFDTGSEPGAPPRHEAPAPEPRELLGDVLTALNGPPSGSAIETAIEFVLDRWASWHLLGKPIRRESLPTLRGESDALVKMMREMTDPPTPEGWDLAAELLWHLGAFSHPVERGVLLSCPRIQVALRDMKGLKKKLSLADLDGSDELLVEATLELLAHWCLIFRIAPRPLPSGLTEDPALGHRYQTARYRYTPHRHMQRHLLRMMGGRNVEPTQWDQFTTTMYASLPDESPSLRTDVHRSLTEVVHTLTDYPGIDAQLPAPSGSGGKAGDIRAMVLHADRIRAAYYLARSTYSPGVISHLAPDEAADATHLGHMEQYRRLVRWITHAARYWEREYGQETGAKPTEAAKKWADGDEPRGIFYPGELIWLYNECGVISLAQGKLHDAEHLLTMAERAARLVEGDDSGSLHTRVRIHSALVQIERGRPHRARLMLAPIANRRNGHPVPPLIAETYLGLVECWRRPKTEPLLRVVPTQN
jgi:SIR2-like domain